MAISHADLLRSILAFDFDDGDVYLSFARRLARENDWSPVYAQRAIVEYKRFIYLACIADHPVTPSDQVDQVWHLHLTYTRSYWDRFCGQTLGRALHHDPTRGGDDEARKYHEQYERTLRTYETAFAEPPPSDIWLPVEARFARRLPVAGGGSSLMTFRIRPFHQGIACVVTVLLTAWSVMAMQDEPSADDGLFRAGAGTIAVVMGLALVLILFAIKKWGGGGNGGGGFSCGSGCGGDGGGGGCGGGD